MLFPLSSFSHKTASDTWHTLSSPFIFLISCGIYYRLYRARTVTHHQSSFTSWLPPSLSSWSIADSYMSKDYISEDYTKPDKSKGKAPVRELVDERGPPRITIEPPSKPSSRSSKSRSNSDSSNPGKMGEHRSSKHSESKSSSKSGSKSDSKSSSKSSYSKPEKDDWSEVNEPDERRRIQNRLAQRKFRKSHACLS